MELKRVKASRTKFLRLSETPSMSVTVECGACFITLEHDGDHLNCPSCGHYWSDFGDGAEAEPIDFTEFDEADFEEEVTDTNDAYLRSTEAKTTYRYV